MQRILASLLLSAATVGGQAFADDLGSALERVRSTGPNGVGSTEAATAWQSLSKAPISQLPALLAAMDGTNSIAKNWLRSAIECSIDLGKSQNAALPLQELELFVLESKHDGQARRFAFDLVQKNDKTARDRLLPKMNVDPDPDLRYEAIAEIIKKGQAAQKAKDDKTAIAQYNLALNSASDKRQIHQSTLFLRELNQKVDLPEKLGLILNWKVVGPFPNEDLKGMDFKYAPESKIDFAAKYQGKEFAKPEKSDSKKSDKDKEGEAAAKPAPVKEATVSWQDYVSQNEHGTISLEKVFGGCERSTAFAATNFQSDADQEVEIKMGCYTAFKLFVNGEMILDRRDEFAGSQMDHYSVRAKLHKGPNQIVVKSVQGQIPPPLTKVWQFQLRVCDLNGKALLSLDRPKVETKPIAPKAPPKKS